MTDVRALSVFPIIDILYYYTIRWDLWCNYSEKTIFYILATVTILYFILMLSLSPHPSFVFRALSRIFFHKNISLSLSLSKAHHTEKQQNALDLYPKKYQSSINKGNQFCLISFFFFPSYLQSISILVIFSIL